MTYKLKNIPPTAAEEIARPLYLPSKVLSRDLTRRVWLLVLKVVHHSLLLVQAEVTLPRSRSTYGRFCHIVVHVIVCHVCRFFLRSPPNKHWGESQPEENP